ncbi:DUF3100 domain-containing protein [Nocardioides maradonensis]
MTVLDTTNATGGRQRLAQAAPLVLITLALTVVAQWIGPHQLDLGIGTVGLYPLVWGLLLGGAFSFQKVRPMPARLQHYATYMVEIAVLLLGARLSFVVGANVKVLLHAGPALLLQELGHLFGTVLFSLPIAVLIKMGRPAVGACFSIDRESSFAIVADKYGADSDEYRGVLSMYVFGTVVGALYVTLLASFFANNHIFDPRALAMGSGVGSGSVMAASSASIAQAHPDMASQILALAAVSNLITTVLGVYVGMYVALPAAERFYRVLTRTGAVTAPAPVAVASPATEAPAATAASADRPPLALTFPLVLAAMLAANVVFHHSFSLTMLAGFALMTAVVLVALALKRCHISPIIGISTIGLLLGSPWSPVADAITKVLTPIDFLTLTTPVLVLAGLGLGKDSAVLRRIGWRVVPVGLVSFAASFLLATLIAQATLGLG